MQHVEEMLREMISKYEKQYAECTREVRLQLGNRPRAIRLMRKRKILQSHIATCEKRLHVCMNKQCALEQLEITKMQINALKDSSTVFKRFARRNSMARIEELTDTMQELSDDLMDMGDLLQTPLQTVDEDEVLMELNQLEEEVAGILPQVPFVATVTTLPQVETMESDNAELELVAV
tara:strand:+ start:2459 stop:2992 length:534 start_codon:yes stop_codon:yes gene_type:complete